MIGYNGAEDRGVSESMYDINVLHDEVWEYILI